ncbi:MAG: citrate/2-methylcitrate synthase [Calditrichia bacterium]
MGYGHRVHSNDPRTQKLFDIATENGVASVHVAMCLAIRDALQERGKSLPVNVDAAIAALLYELDFPETLANAFSSFPGCRAGCPYSGEKSRYKPMRKSISQWRNMTVRKNAKFPIRRITCNCDG